MNTLDILILVVLAGGLAIGFRSGLIKQVLGFAGLIVAFVLSVNLMDAVGSAAASSLGISPDIAPLVGFALVFLVVEVLVFALIRIGETLINSLKLTSLNRLLGGGVGMLKAALVLSVVFLVLGKMRVPSDETRERSSLYASVASVLPTAWDYVTALLPQVESLSERFGERLEERLPATEETDSAED